VMEVHEMPYVRIRFRQQTKCYGFLEARHSDEVNGAIPFPMYINILKGWRPKTMITTDVQDHLHKN